MKLYIQRKQDEKTGFFGNSKGISFLLSCRAELTTDETALVEKYKQWGATVYSYGTTRGNEATWSLRDLIEGKSVRCDGVVELLEGEEEVKKACNGVKVLLDVMKSFGGEEVVEF